MKSLTETARGISLFQLNVHMASQLGKYPLKSVAIWRLSDSVDEFLAFHCFNPAINPNSVKIILIRTKIPHQVLESF